MIPAVAIATCSELPDLDREGQLLRAALGRRGVEAVPAIWNEDHRWENFAGVVLRTAWDYFYAIDQFLDWARQLGDRLVNPPEVVEWNADKRYLFELEADGIPVVSTDYIPPGTGFELPPGQFVVKPAISAGVNDTATYDDARHEPALEHVRALHDVGRTVLIQPYCHRVDVEAETAVIFIDGQVSHCMRKGPLLSLDRPIEEGPWRQEDMSLCCPDADMVELARAAYDVVVRRFGHPLYARVDAVRSDSGAPVVLELELIEPSLFLDFAPGSADKLAAALTRALLPSPASASPCS
jgi:hypothetical protein